MRKLLVFLFLMGGLKTSYSQISVYQSTYFVDNDLLNNSSPVFGGSPVMGNGNDESVFNGSVNNKEVVGCYEVNLRPSTHLKSTSSSSITLSVSKPTLNVFSYSHTSFDNVQALKRFETGVEIPQEIWDKIQLFKTTEDSILGLNPFLEWNVSLVANYTHLESGQTDMNYGFYYENFERNISLNTWNTIQTNEPFRVRYAFKNLTGVWKIEYTLYVDGEAYHTYCPFFVDVKEKDENNGYVKVADNKKVLEKEGELFLPIGHNLTFPEDNNLCSYNSWGIPCGSTAHVKYLDLLHAMHDNGITYFRALLAPQSFDIEYEKIGNYFGRLQYAWEIDKFIEELESLDMYVDLNLLLHFQFQINQPYAYHQWDWGKQDVIGFDAVTTENHYCYSDAFGDLSPQEFLTHPGCIKFYKQRLRHILSRIGYSQNIAILELMSEINEVGRVYDVTIKDPTLELSYDNLLYTPFYAPYDEESGVVATYFWHKEMAEYIKHGLKDRHLIATSYAGNPSSTDLSFSIPEIDIMGYNAYPYGRIDKTFSFQQDVTQYQNLYNKPVYFAETGELGTNICDDGNYYEQLLWQLPFTGICGFNFWDGNKLSYIPQWQEMTKLKNWILNDPMKTETLLGDFDVFNIHSEVTPPATVFHKEFNYLARKQDGIYMYGFGALHNLTDNYLSYAVENISETDDCFKALLASSPSFYRNYNLSTNPEGNQNNWLVLRNHISLNSSTYKINSPTTLANFPSRFRKISNLNEYEEIWNESLSSTFLHPTMCVTNDCFEKNRIYAVESLLFPFQTWSYSSDFIQWKAEEDNLSFSPIYFENSEISSNIVESSSDFDQITTAVMYDMTGRIVKNFPIQSKNLSKVHLEGINAGAYVIRFYSIHNTLIDQSCIILH